MNNFTIIDPLLITDAMLDSSSVAEADETEYDSGTSYSKLDRCMVTDAGVHKIYESQVNTNSDNYPPDNLEAPDDETPAPWLLVSSTNRWKMLDMESRAASVDDDEIRVVFTPGLYVGSLTLLNLRGKTVQLIIDDPDDGIVLSLSSNMTDLTGIDDFWSWCFVDAPRKYVYHVNDLPYYPDATFTVLISDEGAGVQLGELIPGNGLVTGTMENGSSFSSEDDPELDEDEDGNATLATGGDYLSLHDYQVQIETFRVSQYKRLLKEAKAQPRVFVGHADYEESIIYGLARRSSITVDGNDYSTMNLEVKEFTNATTD